MEFYNVVSVLAFLYGSISWTITQANERRIQSVGMKFLRSDYTRNDVKRNAEIWEESI